MLNEYPDILNVRQLAEILNIGKNSAYALINNRVIGCKRIGKKIIIPKSCIVDFINSARYCVEK